MRMSEHVTSVIGIGQGELAAAHGLYLEAQLKHGDTDVAALGRSPRQLEEQMYADYVNGLAFEQEQYEDAIISRR